ncbi:hypothetical protein [Ruegeria sp. HKCCE3926]|uniref:hypothetical protein n=1 Tax=Ruegeria sp. HKCCE3926 TaxID=2794831 RepID=UPI001AE5259F|nr:hypothetical protein [Ruegeria sp. HKCCE3926]
MKTNEQLEKYAELKAEFQKLLNYHESSFRDIDAKAKYWLTVTLPSFIAICGYLTKQVNTLPLAMLVGGSALAACLLISTWCFTAVMLSVRVESGILAPTSRKVEDIDYFLKSPKSWLELSQDQANEMLHAVAINENQNARKSRWLRRGEVSLFFAAPTAACIGGCAAFLYTAACPSRFTTTGLVAGTSAGAAIGISTTAIVIFGHFIIRKSKKPKEA